MMEAARHPEGYEEPVKNFIWRSNIILLTLKIHAALEMDCDPSIVEFGGEPGTKSGENLTWYLKTNILWTPPFCII